MIRKQPWLEYCTEEVQEEKATLLHIERAQLLLPHAHVTTVALFTVSGFRYCFQSKDN